MYVGRLKALVASLSVVACTVLLPGVAMAHTPIGTGVELPGPPDSGGHWAHCNAAISESTGAAGAGELRCQYGPTTARINNLFVRFYSPSSTTVRDIAFSTPTQAGVTKNAGGQTIFGTQFALINGTHAFTECWIEQMSIRDLAGNVIRTYTATAGFPPSPAITFASVGCSFSSAAAPMPTDYFHGGSPGTGDLTTPEGGGTDPETEESCGAWWHIFCHLKAALFWAFVPESVDDEFEGFISDVQGSYPFGPVVWGVEQISDSVSSFQYGLENPTVEQQNNCLFGPELDFGVFETPVALPVVDNCEGSAIEPARVWVRRITSIVLVVGFVLLMFKLFRVATGQGGDE